ncbi:hypothetical protein IWX90DRAFT_500245 [Phyllosticta citrichinensis]|uniref:Uncharacterized protein n=1 Tax=Phyllosticta citrichinensis TaxID=1130410 RepID=A0ABR1Y0G6_9PEZI
MLITSLGSGEVDTPEGVSAPGFLKQDLGESGRWLELNLYGGTVEFIQDPAQDSKKQVWLYALHRKRNTDTKPARHTMGDFSPLLTDARSAVHLQTLPRIGVPGSGASSSDLRNAVIHGMQLQMGSLNGTFSRFMSARELPPKVLAGWNIKMSALKRIPMHPKERLTASA